MQVICSSICSVLCLGLLISCAPYPLYRNLPEEPGRNGRRPGRSAASSEDPLPADAAGGQPFNPPMVKPPPGDLFQPESVSIDPKDVYQIGIASYYGRRFHGRKTANGERFDLHEMTAAHRVLPLGSVIRVTNLENGKSVAVKVNDRGPFVRGKILDLSFGAATALDMVRRGRAKVMIEIIQLVD